MDEMISSVFDSAQKYAAGAEILAQKNDESLHLPSVLCAAFAIELLLKCIIFIQQKYNGAKNNKFKKHTFTELFDLITDQHKEIIVDQFRKIKKENDIDIAKFVNILRNNGNDAFAEWRYSFENDYPKRTQMKIDQKTYADITNAIGESVTIIRNKQL